MIVAKVKVAGIFESVYCTNRDSYHTSDSLTAKLTGMAATVVYSSTTIDNELLFLGRGRILFRHLCGRGPNYDTRVLLYHFLQCSRPRGKSKPPHSTLPIRIVGAQGQHSKRPSIPNRHPVKTVSLTQGNSSTDPDDVPPENAHRSEAHEK